MGSMRKSLKRYHCWCVTPWKNKKKKHIYAVVRSHQPSSVSPLSFDGTSLRLWCAWPSSHPCACPGCVARWPPSHRGRRPRPLRPHSAVWRHRRALATQRDEIGRLEPTKCSQLTSSPSDQLLISRPWFLLMDILRLRGIQTWRRSSTRVSKVKPSMLHISSPLKAHTATVVQFYFWFYRFHNIIMIYEDAFIAQI